MAEGGRFTGDHSPRRFNDDDDDDKDSKTRRAGRTCLLILVSVGALLLLSLLALRGSGTASPSAGEGGIAPTRAVGALDSAAPRSEQPAAAVGALDSAAPRSEQPAAAGGAAVRNTHMAECAPQDLEQACAALVRLAAMCGLRAWKKSTGWLAGGTLCAWHGVRCDEAGDVVELDLGSNGLTGPLPLGPIGQLGGTLRELSLDNNALSGGWPTAPPLSLPRLVRLNVGYNKKLVGPLPDLALAMPSLQYLFLNFCRFTGPVPWLRAARKLRSAYLCGNRGLQGQVPDLRGLADLEYLDLSRNQFDADCPSFAGLQKIRYIDLSRNALHGTIPSMGGHPALQYLLLNHNQLTGALPSLNACADLHSLDASHNKLSGPLPAFELRSLNFIDVSHNALSGPIEGGGGGPRGGHLFGAPKLAFAMLSHNQFSGVFFGARGGAPSRVMPALRAIALAHNRLDGVGAQICDGMPMVFAGEMKAKPATASSKSGSAPCTLAANPAIEADCKKVPECVRQHCGICRNI